MSRFSKKRGSSSVFLMMIMAALSGVVIAFIFAAEKVSIESMSQAYVNLASRSVLSEFNIHLKEDYDIFAVGLHEEDISRRMVYYLSNNFPDEGFIKMKLESLKTNVSNYSLSSTDNFEKQVLEAGIFLIGKKREEKPIEKDLREDKALKNEVILNNLPSNGADSGLLNIDLIAGDFSSIKDLIKSASGRVVTTEYILNYFNYGDGSNISNPTFFRKEVEYILYGKKSDSENNRRLKIDFMALRTVLNLAHIKSDPSKMEGLMAAASVLTPGPEAVITQLVLASIWAGFEAENDWDLINNGYGVAVVKKSGDWALDISAISEEYKRNGYIVPASKSDFSYEDYLRVFLYFEKKDIKLLRMMDLIQINMIGRNDRNFLVKEHSVGFNVKLVINGKQYGYDEMY